MRKSLILPIGSILLMSLITASCTVDEGTQEYRVYAAIIDERDASTVLVMDSTTAYIAEDRSQHLENLEAGMPELSLETFEDYEAKNKESSQLDATMLGPNCELLSYEEWQEMLKEGPGAFYEYGGVLAFSRVGFDREKTQALVYVHDRTDGVTGSGYYVLLSRKGQKWVVQQEWLLWIN